jgi:hypothetical protein
MVTDCDSLAYFLCQFKLNERVKEFRKKFYIDAKTKIIIWLWLRQWHDNAIFQIRFKIQWRRKYPSICMSKQLTGSRYSIPMISLFSLFLLYKNCIISCIKCINWFQNVLFENKYIIWYPACPYVQNIVTCIMRSKTRQKYCLGNFLCSTGRRMQN